MAPRQGAAAKGEVHVDGRRTEEEEDEGEIAVVLGRGVPERPCPDPGGGTDIGTSQAQPREQFCRTQKRTDDRPPKKAGDEDKRS